MVLQGQKWEKRPPQSNSLRVWTTGGFNTKENMKEETANKDSSEIDGLSRNSWDRQHWAEARRIR